MDYYEVPTIFFVCDYCGDYMEVARIPIDPMDAASVHFDQCPLCRDEAQNGNYIFYKDYNNEYISVIAQEDYVKGGIL